MSETSPHSRRGPGELEGRSPLDPERVVELAGVTPEDVSRERATLGESAVDAARRVAAESRGIMDTKWNDLDDAQKRAIVEREQAAARIAKQFVTKLRNIEKRIEAAQKRREKAKKEWAFTKSGRQERERNIREADRVIEEIQKEYKLALEQHEKNPAQKLRDADKDYNALYFDLKKDPSSAAGLSKLDEITGRIDEAVDKLKRQPFDSPDEDNEAVDQLQGELHARIAQLKSGERPSDMVLDEIKEKIEGLQEVFMRNPSIQIHELIAEYQQLATDLKGNFEDEKGNRVGGAGMDYIYQQKSLLPWRRDLGGGIEHEKMQRLAELRSKLFFSSANIMMDETLGFVDAQSELLGERRGVFQKIHDALTKSNMYENGQWRMSERDENGNMKPMPDLLVAKVVNFFAKQTNWKNGLRGGAMALGAAFGGPAGIAGVAAVEASIYSVMSLVGTANSMNKSLNRADAWWDSRAFRQRSSVKTEEHRATLEKKLNQAKADSDPAKEREYTYRLRQANEASGKNMFSFEGFSDDELAQYFSELVANTLTQSTRISGDAVARAIQTEINLRALLRIEQDHDITVEQRGEVYQSALNEQARREGEQLDDALEKAADRDRAARVLGGVLAVAAAGSALAIRLSHEAVEAGMDAADEAANINREVPLGPRRGHWEHGTHPRTVRDIVTRWEEIPHEAPDGEPFYAPDLVKGSEYTYTTSARDFMRDNNLTAANFDKQIASLRARLDGGLDGVARDTGTPQAFHFETDGNALLVHIIDKDGSMSTIEWPAGGEPRYALRNIQFGDVNMPGLPSAEDLASAGEAVAEVAPDLKPLSEAEQKELVGLLRTEKNDGWLVQLRTMRSDMVNNLEGTRDWNHAAPEVKEARLYSPEDPSGKIASDAVINRAKELQEAVKAGELSDAEQRALLQYLQQQEAEQREIVRKLNSMEIPRREIGKASLTQSEMRTYINELDTYLDAAVNREPIPETNALVNNYVRPATPDSPDVRIGRGIPVTVENGSIDMTHGGTRLVREAQKQLAEGGEFRITMGGDQGLQLNIVDGKVQYVSGSIDTRTFTGETILRGNMRAAKPELVQRARVLEALMRTYSNMKDAGFPDEYLKAVGDQIENEVQSIQRGFGNALDLDNPVLQDINPVHVNREISYDAEYAEAPPTERRMIREYQVRKISGLPGRWVWDDVQSFSGASNYVPAEYGDIGDPGHTMYSMIDSMHRELPADLKQYYIQEGRYWIMRESAGDPGAIQLDTDGDGTASYGLIQMIPSNVNDFTNFLVGQNNEMGELLRKAGTPGTEAFNANWREIALAHPVEFADAQMDYFENGYLPTNIAKFESETGYKFASLPVPVQKLMEGVLVQYGGSSSIGNRVVEIVQAGEGKSNAQLIEQIQNMRIATADKYFDDEWVSGVKTRFAAEKQWYMAWAESYDKTGAASDPDFMKDVIDTDGMSEPPVAADSDKPVAAAAAETGVPKRVGPENVPVGDNGKVTFKDGEISFTAKDVVSEAADQVAENRSGEPFVIGAAATPEQIQELQQAKSGVIRLSDGRSLAFNEAGAVQTGRESDIGFIKQYVGRAATAERSYVNSYATRLSGLKNTIDAMNEAGLADTPQYRAAVSDYAEKYAFLENRFGPELLNQELSPDALFDDVARAA